MVRFAASDSCNPLKPPPNRNAEVSAFLRRLNRPAIRHPLAYLCFGFLYASCFLSLLPAAESAPTASEAERLFALHVQPLLAEKCLACHGADADEIEGGLDLRSRSAMMRGGDSFGADVLIPGDAQHSALYRTTTRSEVGFEMPPKEADRLTEQQQWWIRDWINTGAVWPNPQRVKEIQAAYAEGEQVRTSRALSQDWQARRYDSAKLWAYRPIKVAEVPSGRHPIDYFVDQRLAAAGVRPASAAPPQQLVRRMSFGLTGLPPSPEDVVRFCEQYTSDRGLAVSSYAGRLLASPHYGEQFAQHWLDVVRYADTAGFANDFARPNAWRYRDYVVRSFNQDRPYDEFVRDQIAGDEISPDDPEKLVATGFLRMGPWEHTSMSVFKETRQQWLDDVTDSVGQTFLAHAMQCAKCHDHKFDPIPTRDYYRMMAVFSTTQFAEREAEFLEDENQQGFKRSQSWTRAKINSYSADKESLNAKMSAARKAEHGDAKVGDNGLDPGDEASLARISKNMKRHTIELDRVKPLALSVYTGATVEQKSTKGRFELPRSPWAKGQLAPDMILGGGSAYSPTDPVTPGALSVAETLGGVPPREFPAGKGPRRTALADWIVDVNNPLTARVIVNRVWSWHFGKAIAANPNNFGGTGALPTHPELLDYLADWFVRHDWSIKQLSALIVSSDAYQRSSQHADAERLAAADTTGALYAVFLPRRLTAEELRDAMLFASGELNLQVGGIPSRPDIEMEVAMQPRQLMGGTASVYEPDALPAQRNRRTLYAEKNRGLRDPFLESFNQPGPDKSCELRQTSTVAPQALTLLNSQETFDRAIAIAARLSNDQMSDQAILRLAFQLTLCRQPTADELASCLRHWASATIDESQITPSADVYSDRITRTVMAEKTGEPYSFEEYMPAYTNYQTDLQAADVDAKTRALAHVCLVLFNLNEFGYLD